MISSAVKQYGLAPFSPCLPENAPQRPAISSGDASWFDVMCYGKEILIGGGPNSVDRLI
jgi:hypothetical protein